MIQGKFQLLNCYLIKSIAKPHFIGVPWITYFLVHTPPTIIFALPLYPPSLIVLSNAVLFFVFCWFNIKTKDRIKAVFWQQLCHRWSLCQNSFHKAKLDVARVICSTRSHLETDKKIRSEQRRSDRNKNRQQQTVNSLFGKLWNWQLTMKMEL